jgi:hypothetical protein
MFTVKCKDHKKIQDSVVVFVVTLYRGVVHLNIIYNVMSYSYIVHAQTSVDSRDLEKPNFVVESCIEKK